MALVKKNDFVRINKERNTVHGVVNCTYTVFQDNEGNKYFQLDTYGLPGRKCPEKISQSIQFDRESARFLIELFAEYFD